MLASPAALRIAFLTASVVAFTVLASLVRALAPNWLERAVASVASSTGRTLITLGVLAAFAGLLLVNTAYPGYLDHAEPSIVGVSWMALKGTPLYHSFDSAARYSLLYGPTTYLPFVAALWIGGGTTLSVKCMVLLANAIMVYALWRAYGQLLDAWGALFLVAVVLLFLLFPLPNHYLFQTRADIVILSAQAVALFGATRRSGLAGPLALALATAVILDAKASAFIYVLPLWALLLARRGFVTACLTGSGTLVACALPFLLPNISVTQYVSWLRRATGHPSATHDLVSTLRTLPVLLAPLLLIVGPTPWRDQKVVGWVRNNYLALAGLVPCLGVAVVASSRIGAGSHHLLPFVPVLAYLYAELYLVSDRSFALRWPWAVRYGCAALSLILLVRVATGLREMTSPWLLWADAHAAVGELHSVLARYPARTVAMGYGEAAERLSYFRPELVFATSHLLVDEVALSDMAMDGMPIPPTTIAALDACDTEVWLIPKSQQPFAVPSSFADHYPDLVGRQPLFSAAFRETFMRRYSKQSGTAHFDVWVCDGASTTDTIGT